MFPGKEPLRARLSSEGAPALLPVWAEVLCDTETPVGAFARVRELAATRFLLESVVGGERWARYSFVGLGHRLHGRADLDGDRLRWTWTPAPGLSLPDGVPAHGEGLAGVRDVLAKLDGAAVDDLPRFWGGLVGVFGHDFVRAVEDLPIPARFPEPMVPVAELCATETMIVFDNLTQRVKVVSTVCPSTDGGLDKSYARANDRIREVAAALQRPDRAADPLPLLDGVSWRAKPAAPWSQEAHLRSVATAREHIVAGDVFQVVLSQGFDVAREDADLLDIYRALRVTNPAPYMYLMELPSATLVGASPEVLVRVDRDTRAVTVRPIAGTRPRGRTEPEDQALERELLADPKERAEHLMLIDLGRNDVGRVSDGGSVKLTEQFSIERYSRVMHIVSEVTGAVAFRARCPRCPRCILPRRHAQRGAKGPGVAAHRRARAVRARLVRRRRRLPGLRRRSGLCDLHPLARCGPGHTARASRGRHRIRFGPAGRGPGVSKQSERRPAGDRAGQSGEGRRVKPLPHDGRRYEPAQPPGPGAPRVLVIDNYDSFTFNLVQYLLELGAVVDVFRNDAITAADAIARAPTHVLLSPGPGRPENSGVCQDLCRALCEGAAIPLLGVCLGHQTLCEVHGGNVVGATKIMHGKTSEVLHDSSGILARIPSPFVATRYHSLIVEEHSLPPFLLPVARTEAGELMGVRHAERPVYGVQFHPESILSEHGHHLLGNFLAQHGGAR